MTELSELQSVMMVPILRSTEHMKDFVRFGVWRGISFSNTLYSWKYLFYFIVI